MRKMIKMSKNPIITKAQRFGCRFNVVHVWSPIIAKTILWSPIIANFSISAAVHRSPRAFAPFTIAGDVVPVGPRPHPTMAEAEVGHWGARPVGKPRP
jgi:hypothetical protein